MGTEVCLPFGDALELLRDQGGSIARHSWVRCVIESTDDGLKWAGTEPDSTLSLTDIESNDWWWCPF